MNLITKISVKNFKCFRDEVSFDLSQGTYFIGTNNAGKSAVLNAIRVYFDQSLLSDDSFLNKTEFLAKKSGYNKCEITLWFDLDILSTRTFKAELIRKFGGKLIKIKKIISYAPESRKILTYFQVEDEPQCEELPKEIKKLFTSISITYLHPQDGQILFENAQRKLKQRLLANWGRNSNISQAIVDMEQDWEKLRTLAATYLSSSLTLSLQKMWPGCKTIISLPKNIKEIIDISDITFQGSRILPEIELNNQGTGAQSLILYLTHFLLDSDHTLHRGEYHPVWLLEEPESFLHADLVIKLGQELNSNQWLNNIQMLVATHSPILLATSRQSSSLIRWNVLDNFSEKKSKMIDSIEESEINEIGKMMGDVNFYAYFVASSLENKVFLEDSRHETGKSFAKIGINTIGLNGVSEIAKYLSVFANNPELIKSFAFFVVDCDKGKNVLSQFFDIKKPLKISSGFRKFTVKELNNIFIILLPDGYASENLFDEFEMHLDDCCSKLWSKRNNKLLLNVPGNLSRVYSLLRNRVIANETELKDIVKNEQDVKDLFWKNVVKYSWSISDKNKKILLELIV